MKNNKYWAKRAEEIAKIQYDKADKLCKKLVEEYKKADKYIEERINLYYARYANDYGVTLADSKKLLSNNGLNNFKMSLEEFREKAINNHDDKWTKELDQEYLRSRISRLEALKMELDNTVKELSGKQLNAVTGHLKDVYEDTYYRTVYELGKNTGMGVNFSLLNDKAIENAIYSRWMNQKNFAGRIDANKATLLSSLNKTITQGLILGLSSDEMVKRLMKETKISRSRAINLVQTETAFMVGQANTKMYKDFGVEEYEILETLDTTTCETCGEMDGKRFKVSEKQEGLNAPPFHPRCRGTTVPVSELEEIWGDSHRVARDEDGDEARVPQSMNYKRWKIKYIDMTYEERWALSKYTGVTAYTLNESLRENKDLTPLQEDIVKYLDTALEKIPTYGNKTTHRQIGFDLPKEDVYNKFMELHKVGKVINYKQYISSSKRYKGYEVESYFKVEITIDGKTGKDLQGIAGIEEEYEVLFGRDATFKVLKVEGNKIWLKEE